MYALLRMRDNCYSFTVVGGVQRNYLLHNAEIRAAARRAMIQFRIILLCARISCRVAGVLAALHTRARIEMRHLIIYKIDVQPSLVEQRSAPLHL